MVLKDSVYLVTGGASGLGKATVQNLLLEGANVVSCDISPDGASEIFDLFDDDRVEFFQADVTSEDEVRKALHLTRKKFGKLNGVINCASQSISMLVYDAECKKMHELDVFKNVLLVNAVGTFNVIRLAASILYGNEPDENGERGVIINTSHITSFGGPIKRAADCASKAAINGMTIPIAEEMAELKIRVVTVAPSNTDVGIEKQKLFQTCGVLTTKIETADDFAKYIVEIIANPNIRPQIYKWKEEHQ